MPDYAQGNMFIPISGKDKETGKFRIFDWSRVDTWGPYNYNCKCCFK